VCRQWSGNAIARKTGFEFVYQAIYVKNMGTLNKKIVKLNQHVRYYAMQNNRLDKQTK